MTKVERTEKILRKRAKKITQEARAAGVETDDPSFAAATKGTKRASKAAVETDKKDREEKARPACALGAVRLSEVHPTLAAPHPQVCASAACACGRWGTSQARDTEVLAQQAVQGAFEAHLLEAGTLGVRVCRNPACKKEFKPRSQVAPDADQSEFYCSSDCSTVVLAQRYGMGGVLTAIAAEQARRAQTREARSERMKQLRAERPPRVPRATPPAPERKPRKETPPAGAGSTDALAVGTRIVYLGGSKATWLAEGSEGKITAVFPKSNGVRYRVRFATRATVISGETVKVKG